MHGKAKPLHRVFALDLGTTKFCIGTVREATGGQSLTAETVSVPAEGMRRGMLADLAQVKSALTKLVESAEKHFDSDISSVVVGIAGNHLRSHIVKSVTAIEGAQITQKDLFRLMQQVEAENQNETRELLHVVPIGYRIDQRDTIDQPIGFSGRMLTCDYFLIDADRLYLKDVVDVCNASGLQVGRLYSEPFASASVTLPETHRQQGVALADIGGGTTDGIIFRAGRPVYAFTVNVAGKLMTSDLAIGLNIAPDDAEMVKMRFGIRPREGDTVDVVDIKGTGKTLTPANVLQILVPRVHELCSLVAREIMPFRGNIGAGLVLTGGGAGVKGICDYFQSKLAMPVSRARPVLPVEQRHVSQESRSPFEESPHPTKHATVLGLLNLELSRLAEMENTKRNSWTTRYLGPLVNWFKELS